MPVTSTTVAVVAMAASVATQVVPVTSVEAIVQNALLWFKSNTAQMLCKDMTMGIVQ